ncbi:MAG: dockerin type I domain-containing protein [Pirellulales bacterium]|nr:hypothetical protein [Planctomycetales bacterium]
MDVNFQLDSNASQLTATGQITGEIFGLLTLGLAAQTVNGIPGDVANYQGTIGASVDFSGTSPTAIALNSGALDALPSNVALPGLWDDQTSTFGELSGTPTEPADYGFKITGYANVAIRDLLLNVAGLSRPVVGSSIGTDFGLNFSHAFLDVDAEQLGERTRSLAEERVFQFELNPSQDPTKVGDELQWRNIDGVNPNGTPQYGDIVPIPTGTFGNFTGWPGEVNIEDPDFPLSAIGDPDPVLLFDDAGNRLPQIFENSSPVQSMLEVTGVNGNQVELRLTLDVNAPSRFFVDQFLATITLSGQIVATATVDLAPALPGDANGDGNVDGLDYLVWAENFGDDPADDPPGSPANGDLNDDGVVDGLDYILWAGHFGESTNLTSVPEPALTTLGTPLVVGWLVFGRRRRASRRLLR